MKPFLRALAAGSVIVMFGCGGSKDAGPSAVTTSAATTTAATTTVPALTVNDVAISLSDEMNVGFIAAMRAGTAGVALLGPMQPNSGLMALLRLLLPETLYAQAAAFSAPCRRGGSTTIRYGGARSRDINLQGVSVVYSRCGGSAGPRAFVADGQLTANGRWRADNPQDPVRMTGSIAVDEITAPLTIDCTTGPAICVGQVGTISVGPADRPPPPNPTSTTTSTIRPGTTTTVPGTTTSVPATTSVPSGGGSVNVTGTWLINGNPPGTAAMTQTGTTITCTVLNLPAGANQTACGGSINGSNVSLTIGLRVVSGPLAITTTTVLSLVATNSSMSGTYQTSASCQSSDPNIPCISLPGSGGAITLSKQ